MRRQFARAGLKSVSGVPVFFKKAKGAYLYDSAGKKYIDYVGSWGPMIAGHAHADVIRAVQETAADGLSFGAPTEIETRMANKICELMPAIEKVRMVSSGTEAAMSAIASPAVTPAAINCLNSKAATTVMPIHCWSRPAPAR